LIRVVTRDTIGGQLGERGVSMRRLCLVAVLFGALVSLENGPHPDLDSGSTRFCDVIVPALT